MTSGIPTILNRTRTENVAVPVGDRAEQLIANLILSIIAARLDAHEFARQYILRAHDIAVSLAKETLTYRPPQPSMFARLMFNVDSETRSLLLPIINSSLVIPKIRFDAGAGQLGMPQVIDIIGLEVTRFMVRIRTSKTVAFLEKLKVEPSVERLAEEGEEFLVECLNNEIFSTEPLDRAADCIALARDFLQKRHFPLASLALTKADLTLDLVETTSMPHHPRVVQGMKDQLKWMIDELRQTAT
jgi:hypothetical protein